MAFEPPRLHVAKQNPAWVEDRRQPVPAHEVSDAYATLLRHAERAEWQREGLRDTPGRAARAWGELTAGYDRDPADLFTTFETDGYDEMVTVGPVPFFSLCEHHLLPFFGHVHMAYVPAGRIVGLSKLARLVREVYAPRLQVQERLTVQLADALEKYLEPAGVAVVVEARHLCMEMRGVRSPDTATSTSALRGAMKDKPPARAEALALLHRRNP